MFRSFLFLALFASIVFQSLGQNNHPIVVSSFNLRFDTPHDGLNAWPNRRDFVKQLIRYHEFDIMGTQELLYSQIQDLLQLEEFVYFGAGRDDGHIGGEHSAIFYKKERFALLDSGNFWLSETPDVPSLGWDARCCYRICSWVKLLDRLNDRAFYVFNAHFDHEGVVARRESGRLMKRKIEEIAGSHAVMLLGDLNSVPETEPILEISTILSDAYLITELPPYGPVGTFNAFRLDAPLKNRIDYIFVSDDFRVEKYGALTDFRDGRFPSDHLPVVVRVVFK